MTCEWKALILAQFSAQQRIGPPSLKLRFSAFWGLQQDRRVCFFFQENEAFNLSVTQSIPTSNEQMMKTKLSTSARKQILRKTIRNVWKNDWNIALTRLKHNVKPEGLSENKSSLQFVADLSEQSSRVLRRPSVLIETPREGVNIAFTVHVNW